MAGGLGLGSLFGTSANASGLGNLLGNVTSGLGSGLMGNQTIGGADPSQTIADALGWSYGLGDQTGSTQAQVALGDAGPTAMGTAQQYMQGQQQQNQPDAQAALDQGQATPAQRALAAQPGVSMAQAYGPEGPWAPGGSSAPGASAQGPQAPTQVAGPATTAGAPPLGTQTPPGGWVTPERSAMTSSGSPVTPSASYSAASPEQMSAARQALSQGLQQKFNAQPTEPIYDQSQVNPMDPVGKQFSDVPLPQPRPAAADAAPPQVARNVPPPTPRATPPAAVTPPAANDPAARAAQPPATQGAAPQNPIQGIMQALGLGQLPPPLQQLAQQVLGQLFPQLMGIPYGYTAQNAPRWATPQEIQRYRQTGQLPGHPSINPVTGNPYTPARRGDLAPEERARLDQSRSGGWEPVPGGIGGQPYWRNPGEYITDSPGRSGDPYAPDPSKPDYSDPREWKYNPKTKGWGPNNRKQPPPGIHLPPEKTAANLPNRSMEDRMPPEDIRKQELEGMTPEQRKKLRDLLKRRRDEGRRMVAQVGGPTTGGRRDLPVSERLKERIETGPNQPVIGYPPPGNTPWGYNQPYFDPATGQMVRPNNDPNRDLGTTWMNQYFRGS